MWIWDIGIIIDGLNYNKRCRSTFVPNSVVLYIYILTFCSAMRHISTIYAHHLCHTTSAGPCDTSVLFMHITCVIQYMQGQATHQYYLCTSLLSCNICSAMWHICTTYAHHLYHTTSAVLCDTPILLMHITCVIQHLQCYATHQYYLCTSLVSYNPRRSGRVVRFVVDSKPRCPWFDPRHTDYVYLTVIANNLDGWRENEIRPNKYQQVQRHEAHNHHKEDDCPKLWFCQQYWHVNVAMVTTAQIIVIVM